MAIALRPRIWSRARVSLALLLLAIALLPFADIEISSPEPWRVLGRFFGGFLSPRFSAIEDLFHAVSLTLAFALVGVAAGAGAGFLLMLAFHHAAVRGFCAAIRAVHEVFWALIFLQMLGPAPLTGVLAIAVPYAGIFAKVFHEMVEEADRAPAAALQAGVSPLAAMFYARLPLVQGAMRTYALYRVECGLRSSAVLGFVGLPTLGFQLDSFFRQGAYDASAALLLIFYALIATVRLWCRPALLPLYLVAALVLLASVAAPPADPANILRFLAHDIVPAPLRDGGAWTLAGWARFADWAAMLVARQALPGLAATLVVTVVAAAAMGAVALACYPLLVTRLVGPAGRVAGHVVLVVARSTPELMLAYLCLQILGPSMLPAIVALALHNGAIIAHLLGRQAETLPPRPDGPRGLDLYAWEMTPLLYGQFMAYALYRAEIVFRESAILGLLGVRTLGFYVENGIAELRLDRAAALIALGAAVTLLIDAGSRRLRAGLRVRGAVDCA